MALYVLCVPYIVWYVYADFCFWTITHLMKLNEIPVKLVQSYRNVLFLEQSTLQLPQICYLTNLDLLLIHTWEMKFWDAKRL